MTISHSKLNDKGKQLKQICLYTKDTNKAPKTLP